MLPGPNEPDLALAAAMRGDRVDPAASTASLHLACALADADEVERRLGAGEDACAESGIGGWSPIVASCCSRHEPNDPRAIDARSRIVAALLAKGANPNDGREDFAVESGRRSVLAGATGILRSAGVAERLLREGAIPHDPDALLEAASHDALDDEDPLACLRLLLERRPPRWMMTPALAARVERDDVAAAEVLLVAGADANAGGGWGRGGTSVHHAVRARCGAEMIRLLASRADLSRADRDGRTAYAIAVRLGHIEAAHALRQLGAHDGDLTPLDRALALAMRGDVSETKRMIREIPDLAAGLRRSDHQLLTWSIRQQFGGETITALLMLDVDPSIRDDDGTLPVHAAAAMGDVDAIEQLHEAGARLDVTDFDGRTPLDHAAAIEVTELRRATVARLLELGATPAAMTSYPTGDEELDRTLAEAGAFQRPDRADVFERAADAVVAGDLAGLERLLADHSWLPRARSPRTHRATLLHYVAANGVETHRQKTPANAVAIAERLLDAGADVDALCATYGGGPAQTTLSLLVSSGWPAEAGLQGDLVAALHRFGAKLDGLDGDGVPLATAIAFRCPQAVRALVRAGATLDNPVFAAAAGRADLLESMIDVGGKARADAGHCRVPWLSVSNDPRSVAGSALVRAAQFGHEAAVELLLDRGVDPDATTGDGITAIHEASFAGHAAVVERLIDRGADPGLRDGVFDATALGWAREAGHQDLVRRIAERFAPDMLDASWLGLADRVREILAGDISQVSGHDGRGRPLRAAAAAGHGDVVDLLLAHGADPTSIGDDGRDARQLAQAAGHTEIASRLAAHRVVDPTA